MKSNQSILYNNTLSASVVENRDDKIGFAKNAGDYHKYQFNKIKSKIENTEIYKILDSSKKEFTIVPYGVSEEGNHGTIIYWNSSYGPHDLYETLHRDLIKAAYKAKISSDGKINLEQKWSR